MDSNRREDMPEQENIGTANDEEVIGQDDEFEDDELDSEEDSEGEDEDQAVEER
jgi:hypothetical protein